MLAKRHQQSPHSRDRVANCHLRLPDLDRRERGPLYFGVLAAVVVFLIGQALRYVLACGK
jgi:hypothetical protein